jgi:hypothetical protein
MRWRFRFRAAHPGRVVLGHARSYHYVRLQPGDGRTDFLIVGGADHKSGEADDADLRFEALEAWARNLIPALKDETHRWSGQVLDTIDYAAFIGRNPGNENIYVHTGDSGQGMTHGVVGSLINTGLITGEDPEWQKVYEPTRKNPIGISNYLRENLTAVKNLAEYLTPGELSSVDDLKPGQGAISGKALPRSQPIAIVMAPCMPGWRPAPMSVVTCTGILSRSAGIALATARNSRWMVRHSMHLRSVRSPR